jgi:hypothetical protein
VDSLSPHGPQTECAVALSAASAGCKPHGQAAQSASTARCTHAGAVLLRNLPLRSAADIVQLTEAAAAAPGAADDWIAMNYEPFGAPRDVEDGVMKATTIPASFMLPCHNEMSYNPCVPRRLGLVCLQPAPEGGETLLARNADLTEVGPQALLDFVRAHGGVRYTRRYYDETNPPSQVRPPLPSATWAAPSTYTPCLSPPAVCAR